MALATRLRSTSHWSDPRVKPPYGAVELDKSLTLARGLIGCWVLNEGIPTARDLVNEADLFPTNGPKASVGPKGQAVSFAGASSQYLVTAGNEARIEIAADAPLSFLTAARPQGSFVNHRNVFFKSGDYGLICFSDGSWNAQTSLGDVVAATALTLERDYVLGATFTGGTAGNVTGTAYVNGIVDAIDSTGLQTGGGAPTNVLSLGADSVNSRFWNGLIYFLYVFNTTKTAAEMFELSQLPYSFFRPIIRRRYFFFTPAAAAGGIFIQERLGRGIGRGVLIGR